MCPLQKLIVVTWPVNVIDMLESDNGLFIFNEVHNGKLTDIKKCLHSLSVYIFMILIDLMEMDPYFCDWQQIKLPASKKHSLHSTFVKDVSRLD